MVVPPAGTNTGPIDDACQSQEKNFDRYTEKNETSDTGNPGAPQRCIHLYWNTGVGFPNGTKDQIRNVGAYFWFEKKAYPDVKPIRIWDQIGFTWGAFPVSTGGVGWTNSLGKVWMAEVVLLRNRNAGAWDHIAVTDPAKRKNKTVGGARSGPFHAAPRGGAR